MKAGVLPVVAAFVAISFPMSVLSEESDCADPLKGIKINQKRALHGGVTPGDTPGFPVTISKPGKYKLTSNLKITDQTTDAIVVTADNVTIDLNGFAILGPTTCTGRPVTSCTPVGPGSGIVSSNSNISIKNGTIQGMGTHGVYLFGNFNNHLENLTVRHNGANGINLLDSVGNTVEKSRSAFNGGRGIDAAFGSVVTHNVSEANGEKGMVANSGCNVIGNVIIENGAIGLAMADNTGYSTNVMVSNQGGNVTGGVALGANLCDAALCP